MTRRTVTSRYNKAHESRARVRGIFKKILFHIPRKKTYNRHASTNVANKRDQLSPSIRVIAICKYKWSSARWTSCIVHMSVRKRDDTANTFRQLYVSLTFRITRFDVCIFMPACNNPERTYSFSAPLPLILQEPSRHGLYI